LAPGYFLRRDVVGFRFALAFAAGFAFVLVFAAIVVLP
jgi:hypothetical protein